MQVIVDELASWKERRKKGEEMKLRFVSAAVF
jgi:hypothetical protein